MLKNFQVTQKSYFKWFQLINAIPESLRLAVLNDKGNYKISNQKNQKSNHHLIKSNHILAIEKLIPRELYFLSIVLKNKLPTSQKYFPNIFHNLPV